MIVNTTVEIDGTSYDCHYSDAGRYVCRDGQQWEEAVDPLNSGRVYTEGGLIEDDESEAQAVLDILLGGPDDND